MTVASLLRALARRATTDPVGAVRQVHRRLREDPLWVLMRLDESLSSEVRQRVYPPLERIASWLARRFPMGLWTLLLVFLRHGSGRRTDAVALLEDRVGHTGRGQVSLARFAAEIGEPRLGLRLLEPLPDRPRVVAVRARALEHAGRLREAVDTYDAVLGRRRDPTAKHRRERLADDLRALEEDFRPGVAPRSPITPRAGRVAHLLNNSLPQKQAGYTVRAHRTMQAQRDVGLDPFAVTKLGYPWAQGYFDATASDVVDGLVYHHLREDRLRELGTATRVELAVQRLAPMLAEQRPAVLHPTTPYDNAQVAIGLRDALEVPVVYEVRGFLEDTWLSRYPDEAREADRYRLHREAEARWAARADHVVTLGDAMRDDLVARGVPADRVSVVPNAVDLGDFEPRGTDPELRRSLGIGPGEVVLGYISSLVPYEGVDVLIDAVRLLRDRGHAVRMLVVGEGSHRPALERHARDAGLGPDVARFTGRVPHADVARYYEQIDVFVVPRTADRVCRYVTPLKPVEAMALERCVVVSDVPALAEMVEEGETGLTFPVEDPAGLADVVAPLIADADLRQSIGAKAREFVAAERTWHRNAERYLEIYRALGAV